MRPTAAALVERRRPASRRGRAGAAPRSMRQLHRLSPTPLLPLARIASRRPALASSIGDAVDGDDPVARLQARRSAGAARLDVAEDRLAPGIAEADAAASSWRRRRRRRATTSARWTRRWPRPSRALTSSSMSSPCSIACVTCQRRSVSERTSLHSAPSCDQARTQSPARMPACSATLAAAGGPSTRLRLVDADPVRGRVQRDREQQVGERPGGDDRGALPERLAVEGAVELARGRRRLRARRACARSRRRAARRSTNSVLVGPRLAAPEDAAEADREAQHLDAASHGDAVVAVLVDDDQHAERQEEGEDGDHHRPAGCARARAASRLDGTMLIGQAFQELGGAPARLVVEREQRLERVGGARRRRERLDGAAVDAVNPIEANRFRRETPRPPPRWRR